MSLAPDAVLCILQGLLCVYAWITRVFESVSCKSVDYAKPISIKWIKVNIQMRGGRMILFISYLFWPNDGTCVILVLVDPEGRVFHVCHFSDRSIFQSFYYYCFAKSSCWIYYHFVLWILRFYQVLWLLISWERKLYLLYCYQCVPLFICYCSSPNTPCKIKQHLIMIANCIIKKLSG